MDIILLEQIANLGALGDKVAVKNGYARNYLIPQGKAKPATKKNLEEFEARRAELEAVAAETLAKANARKEAIEKVGSVTIAGKTASETKLFGSISNIEIVEATTKAGLDIEKREVLMPDGALRELGEYEISISLHTSLNAVLKVIIVAED